MVDVLQGRTITDRSADYLGRVASLYVQALDLETGVMCRAALEAALLSRLEDEIDGDAPLLSLDGLLQLAGRTDALAGYDKARTKRGWRARSGTPLHRADRIRRAGNFIIHDFLRYPDEADAIKNALNAFGNSPLYCSNCLRLRRSNERP